MQRSWLRLVVVLSLIVLGLAVGTVAGVDTGEGQADPASLAQDIDADSVVLTADIDADGNADWTVEYRLDLDDETDESAFDELVSDIEADRSAYLDPFEERIRTTAGTAETTTGRPMSVGEFDLSTTRRDQPQGAIGVVTFEFEWTGFAAADGDRIQAGDALDRLILAENERLQFRWPESYSLQSSSPEPGTVENQRVVWRGPTDFDTGQPRIELAADEEGSGLSFVWLLGPVVIGLLLVAFGFYWRQRDSGVDKTDRDQPTASESTAEATTEPADDSTEPPPELLSNEERALQLLQDNGGRMKQKALADELDWSAAKTSQVVADLREDDRVESFRLGRENVLTLPDVDIDGTLSDDDADTPD